MCSRILQISIIALFLTFMAPSVKAVDGESENANSEQIEFFESKIRPILVQHCYECHSAQSGEDLEGGLFLDSRMGWQKGGDSGPAIIPGDADESLVMHAVRYQEDVVSAMPPSSKLSEDQIKLLAQWIRDGAADPRNEVASHDDADEFQVEQRFKEHWSWRRVQKPAVPRVAEQSWPNNFIDNFVLSRLESEGIKPAVAADKAIWLRRVYFDLIGLPPTIDQIDAFMADPSDMAREKVVTSLLESQHFGEKWARHWLDLVRYAETYGHEFDYPIPVPHEYRDYVIRALNLDVPYDQLIREHIAGDLIESPRRHPSEDFNESIIGTGFWYLHEATHAPTDVLKNESDIIDNQIDVLGKAFMGLTVACARCHDHKFDAISTADYYALSGYLQSSCRQVHPLDPNGLIGQSVEQFLSLQDDYRMALSESELLYGDDTSPGVYLDVASQLIDEVGNISIEEIAKDHGLNAAVLGRWVDGLRDAKPKLDSQNLLDVFAFYAKNSNAKRKLSQFLQEESRKRDAYDGTLFEDFSGTQLPDGWSLSGQAFQTVSEKSCVIPIDDLPRCEPGTIDSGVFGKAMAGTLRSPTFTISTNRIHIRMRATEGATVRLIVDNYQMATFNQLLFRGLQVDKKAADTRGSWVWKSLGADLRKYVGHKAYLEFIDDGQETIAVDEIWFSNSEPPRAKSYLASSLLAGWDDAAAWWRKTAQNYRDAHPNRVLSRLFAERLVDQSRVTERTRQIEHQATKIANSIPRPRFVLAMAQGTPENAHVYVRGNSGMLGEELPPRNLQAFGGRPGDRLQLAEELATIENPLTSRVMVNRLWHHLFGRGIVPTTDDFGPQGQPPSHPELLDALAYEFANDGWSIKRAIRNIVLSKTYAQSSNSHPANDAQRIANIDPTNTLLHRMPIRRLPAESIRDQILAVSGRLNRKPFGKSVPTYRTPFMTGRGARPSGPMDGDGRRSVYLAVYRNFLNPFMLTFDVPNPFGPKGRRSVSNVPAQSLTLMNDPFILEQAKLWAKAVLEKDFDAEERIAQMVRSAHGTAPDQSQLKRFIRFAKQHPEAGKNEHQVWADMAHVLFNMKAFYYLR